METVSQEPFFVRNCSIAALATGQKASSLSELRDKLLLIDENSLYFHFWGAHLNPQFVHPQYHNDFAMWAHLRLHDQVLAERLSIVDPGEFKNLEELRQEVLEIVERRMDDHEATFWTKREDQFYFISAKTIVFDSGLTLKNPQELLKTLPLLSAGSIFYHFIDARMRLEERKDDFSVWLRNFGSTYEPLVHQLQNIDPYFLSLSELKQVLNELIRSV